MAYGKVNVPSGAAEGGEACLLAITFDGTLIGKPYSVTGGGRTMSGTVPIGRKVRLELAGLGREYRIRAGDTEAWGEAAVETEEGTAEYAVTVAGTPSTGDVKSIQIDGAYAMELVCGRDGTPLAIPCYGVEAQQALIKILGVCDTQEPAGGKRSEAESAILACMAERQGDRPPNVFLYRGYVSQAQAELGTVNIIIEAVSRGSQVRAMGNSATTANKAAAADKEAGAGNVTVANYSRGYNESRLALTVTLARLKEAAAQVPGCRYGYDEWLRSWPVEFVYFKVTTGEEVRYYILELRVIGAGESGRQRAIAYVDDGEQEGYALWVYGARAYTGNDLSVRKKQYMAAVDYKKDANGQEVYATDTQGGYLETTLLEDGSYAYADTAHSRNIRITKEGGIYRYVDAATGEALSNPGAALLLDERGAPVRIPADIVENAATGKGYHTDENGAALLDMGGRYIPKRFHAKVSSKEQDGGIGIRWNYELEHPGTECQESVYRLGTLAPGETGQVTLAVRTKEDKARDTAGEEMAYGELEYEVNIEREDNGDIAEDYPFFAYLFGSPTGTGSDRWSFFPKGADGVFRQVCLDKGSIVPMSVRAYIGSGCTVRFSYVNGSGETVEAALNANSSNTTTIYTIQGHLEVKAIVSDGTEEREYTIIAMNGEEAAAEEEPEETALPRI